MALSETRGIYTLARPDTSRNESRPRTRGKERTLGMTLGRASYALRVHVELRQEPRSEGLAKRERIDVTVSCAPPLTLIYSGRVRSVRGSISDFSRRRIQWRSTALSSFWGSRWRRQDGNHNHCSRGVQLRRRCKPSTSATSPKTRRMPSSLHTRRRKRQQRRRESQRVWKRGSSSRRGFRRSRRRLRPFLRCTVIPMDGVLSASAFGCSSTPKGSHIVRS